MTSPLAPAGQPPGTPSDGQTRASVVTVRLRDAGGAPVNGVVTLAGIKRSTSEGRATFSLVTQGIQRGSIEVNGQILPLEVRVSSGGVVEETITIKATPTPIPLATPRATPLPTPRPTATPSGPPPVPPPAVVFDLRGRVLVGGAGSAGVSVRVTGATGAVTATDATVSGAGGTYSFFLGGGTYSITASQGTRSVTRQVVIPFGGQTVDNFNLNL